MTSNCIELQTSALLFASHDILKANLANKCPDSLVGQSTHPLPFWNRSIICSEWQGGSVLSELNPHPKRDSWDYNGRPLSGAEQGPVREPRTDWLSNWGLMGVSVWLYWGGG